MLPDSPVAIVDVVGGGAVLTGESLASNIASATVTTNDETCSLIKLIATLADGQTDVYFFKVNTKDPTCSQSGNGKY